MGSVKRFVAQLVKKSPDVHVVMQYEPGEAAQVDFGTGPELPDPVTGEIKQTQVFVMTLCHSRHMYAELVWDQKIETWLRCHINAFQHFGGLPRKIIIDNLKAAITKACRHDPVVQKSYEGFAALYLCRHPLVTLSLAPPAWPGRTPSRTWEAPGWANQPGG